MTAHVFDLPDFSFKGGRTYLHGTDFFDVITRFLSSALPPQDDGFLKDLSFRKFANKQCRIYLESLPETGGECVCQGVWYSESANPAVRFWVVEREEPVTEFYAFDETSLCSGSELFEDGVRNTCVPGFSLIENVVALTKHFHNWKWPLATGKWVFGQVVLNQALPSQCDVISIQNHQKIKNRFSRNKIFVDQKEVGEIRFIVSNTQTAAKASHNG